MDLKILRMTMSTHTQPTIGTSSSSNFWNRRYTQQKIEKRIRWIWRFWGWPSELMCSHTTHNQQKEPLHHHISWNRRYTVTHTKNKETDSMDLKILRMAMSTHTQPTIGTSTSSNFLIWRRFVFDLFSSFWVSLQSSSSVFSVQEWECKRRVVE